MRRIGCGALLLSSMSPVFLSWSYFCFGVVVAFFFGFGWMLRDGSSCFTFRYGCFRDYCRVGFSDFIWRDRLLVIENGGEEWAARLEAEKAGVEERDMGCFVLWGKRFRGVFGGRRSLGGVCDASFTGWKRGQGFAHRRVTGIPPNNVRMRVFIQGTFRSGRCDGDAAEENVRAEVTIFKLR